jgi:dolichol-phosphate mannosyltransferase
MDLSIITATYNEKENISLLIPALNKIFAENKIKGEVIVVDDSSPDGTSETVLKLKEKYPNTVLVKRPGKLGIGSAYFDGIKASFGKYLIMMDADFSMPPSSIPELYRITQQETGKIGWGSRYLGDTKFETDFAHLIGTSFLNHWVSFWLNTGIKDNTLGFFCISRNHFNLLLKYAENRGIYPFNNTLYGLSLAALAVKNDLRLVEVPAPYERRIYGQTKIPFLSGLKIVFKDLLYTLSLRSKLSKKINEG